MLKFTFKTCILLSTFAFGTGLVKSWAVCQRFINVAEPDLSSLDSGGPAESGSLLWQVRQAKARGERHLPLGIQSCGMRVSTLAEALTHYSVVIAQPVAKRTYVGEHSLVVWYKFKVLDVLSQKPLPQYRTWSWQPDITDDLTPVEEDEMLIQGGDGSAWVEGVTVTQRTNGPDYSLSEKYLLFLTLDSTRHLAYVPWPDEAGVFTVSDEGVMKATDGGSYDLKDQMGKRFGNEVEKLRNYFAGQRGTVGRRAD